MLRRFTVLVSPVVFGHIPLFQLMLILFPANAVSLGIVGGSINRNLLRMEIMVVDHPLHDFIQAG
jgi:hypothetical protein